MINNKLITDALDNIIATAKSIEAFFYQKTLQNIFTNNNLATYTVDYALLVAGSEHITDLTDAQISSQMQAYIDLCDALRVLINSNIETQTALFYEKIQNQLNDSIVQLSGWGSSLLNAQYENLYRYTVPYNMGFSEVLYLNGINLDDYAAQAKLNYSLPDFNNILQNTIIILNK